jgi:DNA-binding IscR family transcriptional regulator
MQSPDLLPDSKGGHLITMGEALTLKQQAVRDFIEAYHQREGISPSLREIQGHFGFASPNAAAKHLAALRRKGVLQRSAGRARGLVLSESADRLISEIPILGAIPAGQPLSESEQREGCVRVDLDTLGIPKNARTFADSWAALESKANTLNCPSSSETLKKSLGSFLIAKPVLTSSSEMVEIQRLASPTFAA